MKLDVLRLFVEQRLAAVTDDIFRCLARTVAEYEHEVLRLKQDIDRQRRLLQAAGGPGAAPGATPGAAPAGVSTTEEEQQVRGRSQGIKQEEDRASVPEKTFTPSPDWLRERLETDWSSSSNQIQSCREEAGPQPTKDKQEVFSVKQEVGEGHMMPKGAARAEISSQQEGVLQVLTTEEEQQDEGGVSVPVETDGMFTPIPDWLRESDSDLHMRSEPGETSRPPDHNRDSILQSESTEDSNDARSEPGLQMSQGTWIHTPADQNLVCCSCGREFSSKQTLKKHIRQNLVLDQEQMSCSRRRHRIPYQSPAKTFTCRICRSSYYTQGLLVRHAEIHCREPENRCGACGDRLDSTEALRNHLWSHKVLGSTCDVCGKKCTSIATMEIHKRVHTGEKPYHCGFCSQDFSRKESLERHLKVHSGDRPHHCGLCRRSFTRREYLVHHMKTSHPERPVPPAGTEGTRHFSLMLRNMSEKWTSAGDSGWSSLSDCL